MGSGDLPCVIFSFSDSILTAIETCNCLRNGYQCVRITEDHSIWISLVGDRCPDFLLTRGL